MSIATKRVLITRAAGQASQLATLLEARGAVPISIPSIEIIPPASYAQLDDAVSHLGSYDWIVFTSANSVDPFIERLKRVEGNSPKERDPVSSKLPQVAVIGPATAKAVQGSGLSVALMPPRFVAESLAESLAAQASGKRVLLVRAEEARDVLPDSLTRVGAQVTIAPAYRNQIPTESVAAIRALFASPAGSPDAITCTSASTARNVAALLDAAALALPSKVALASIGPITSQALREVGLTPAVEAGEATVLALVEALAQYFEAER